VEDVGDAHPRIREAVETMIKKGKWTVPGKYCHYHLLLPAPIIILHLRIQGEVWRSLAHVDCPYFSLDTIHVHLEFALYYGSHRDVRRDHYA
jgi:hypothetical protein